MKRLLPLILLSSFIFQCCTNVHKNIKEGSEITLSQYYDTTGRDDILWGGIKMIKISTPKGDFNVWTKRTGNNPRIKVLLLHGGPELLMNTSNALIVIFQRKDLNFTIMTN